MDMQVKSYKDLIVWQKAMDLLELVYQASQKFNCRIQEFSFHQKLQAVQTEVKKMTNALLSKLVTNHSPLTTNKDQAVTRLGGGT